MYIVLVIFYLIKIHLKILYVNCVKCFVSNRVVSLIYKNIFVAELRLHKRRHFSHYLKMHISGQYHQNVLTFLFLHGNVFCVHVRCYHAASNKYTNICFLGKIRNIYLYIPLIWNFSNCRHIVNFSLLCHTFEYCLYPNKYHFKM